MVYKVFLDINILMDFFVANRVKHNEAKKIIELAETHKIKGYISESVVNTCAYLLRKDYSESALKKIFEEMLSILSIVSGNNTTFLKAWQNGIDDMEDAVLFQIAKENKIDYFITNDKADFKKAKNKDLPIISSEVFLKMFP